MSVRLERIVERLRLRPTDHVLEIGCGHGIAADLICRRLHGGRLVAIDRSAKMIEAAARRNASHIAAGLAEFHVVEFETFDPGAVRFDVIVAVRVGIFHREPGRTQRIVRAWLAPRGRIVAEYDEP